MKMKMKKKTYLRALHCFDNVREESVFVLVAERSDVVNDITGVVLDAESAAEHLEVSVSLMSSSDLFKKLVIGLGARLKHRIFNCNERKTN